MSETDTGLTALSQTDHPRTDTALLYDPHFQRLNGDVLSLMPGPGSVIPRLSPVYAVSGGSGYPPTRDPGASFAGYACEAVDARRDSSPFTALRPDVGLKSIFYEQLGGRPATWPRVASLLSPGAAEAFSWLSALTGAQVYPQETPPAALAAPAYTTANDVWTQTATVSRATLQKDLYQQIADTVAALGRAGRVHLDNLVFPLIAGGFAAPVGAVLFGNQAVGHAQSNKGAEALSAVALADAIAAMLRFHDAQNLPLDVMPDTLIVPPEAWSEAQTLLKSAFYPDPVSDANQQIGANYLQGVFSLVMPPALTNAANWFLVDSKRPVRPILLKLAVALAFDSLKSSQDTYTFTATVTSSVGYGDWTSAFGSQAG